MTISKTTIAAYKLTAAAVKALEEAGISDAGVDDDFTKLVGDGAALLHSCLDGADDDRVQGWTDYVSALAAASARNADEAAIDDQSALRFRALDVVTDWQGPAQATEAEAQADADRHNEGCVRQRGYGSAVVVTNDDGRCSTLAGAPVWPQHGRSTGAVRWA